jgi:hypothetical protein
MTTTVIIISVIKRMSPTPQFLRCAQSHWDSNTGWLVFLLLPDSFVVALTSEEILFGNKVIMDVTGWEDIILNALWLVFF